MTNGKTFTLTITERDLNDLLYALRLAAATLVDSETDEVQSDDEGKPTQVTIRTFASEDDKAYWQHFRALWDKVIGQIAEQSAPSP